VDSWREGQPPNAVPVVGEGHRKLDKKEKGLNIFINKCDMNYSILN
jgi:hypothetical protein